MPPPDDPIAALVDALDALDRAAVCLSAAVADYLRRVIAGPPVVGRRRSPATVARVADDLAADLIARGCYRLARTSPAAYARLRLAEVIERAGLATEWGAAAALVPPAVRAAEAVVAGPELPPEDEALVRGLLAELRAMAAGGLRRLGGWAERRAELARLLTPPAVTPPVGWADLRPAERQIVAALTAARSPQPMSQIAGAAGRTAKYLYRYSRRLGQRQLIVRAAAGFRLTPAGRAVALTAPPPTQGGDHDQTATARRPAGAGPRAAAGGRGRRPRGERPDGGPAERRRGTA